MARQGQAKVLSENEIKRVYLFVKDGRQSLRNVCLLDFSFKLGLRVKEMASLKIENVVDGSGKIKETFILGNDQSKGSNGGRTIYLTNKTVRKNLQAYLDTRDSGTMLFQSQKSGFCPNSLQQVFKRMYVKAEIDGAKSHSGRRTFATRLIQAGYDIKSVSLLMGHKSIQMTSRYIQENPVMLGQMVAGL